MTTQTRFTPGYWHIETNATNGHHDICARSAMAVIAAVQPSGDDAEDAANASLIATAPRLYAALERILSMFDEHCRDASFDEARAALKQARGEI